MRAKTIRRAARRVAAARAKRQLRLALLVSREDEDNSADQANAAEDGREGDVVLLVRTHLQRAGIDHFFARSVGKAAVGKGNDANRDQNDPDDPCRFHARSLNQSVRRPWIRLMMRMTTAMTRSR